VTAGFTDYFTTPAFVHEYLDFLARSNDYTSTQSLLISLMMPLVNFFADHTVVFWVVNARYASRL